MIGYKAKLVELGIVESRVDDLFTAMDSLHNAICKLDNQQLAVFSKHYGVIGHLDMFAREEGVRNVATEMYETALRRSAKQIDFDEFEEFSDKLLYMAEEAHEVGIPGSQQLCRSLCDLRKRFESTKGFFSRIARQAQAISKITGTASYPLEVRITSKYKDAYRHLDESETIGTTSTLHCVEREKNEEHGDSGTDLIFVQVHLDEDLSYPSDETIRKALHNTYSYHGCGHEHDCCGCRHQSVTKMKRLTHTNCNDDVWALQISWGLNL